MNCAAAAPVHVVVRRRLAPAPFCFPATVASNLSMNRHIAALESDLLSMQSSSACQGDKADSEISDNRRLSAFESDRPGVHIRNLSVSSASHESLAGDSGGRASSVLALDDISSRAVRFREHTAWHTPLVVKSFIRWIMLAFCMAVILLQSALPRVGDSRSRLTLTISGRSDRLRVT